MLQDQLNKTLNPNLYYIVWDKQKHSISYKKGGALKYFRYLLPLKDMEGNMISRTSEEDIQFTLNQLLSMYKTYGAILSSKNEIVDIFKQK